MAAKDRIIEVIYRLKDLFSRDVGKVTSSFKKVGDESDKSTNKLERNNERLRKSFRNIGTVVAGAGLAGGAGAFAGLRSLADEIDRVQKTAAKLGVSTEELSKLEFAARLSGVSANTLGTALQRLTRRVSEAASGTGEARKALQELSVSAEELEQLTPDEQFLRLSDALRAIPNQTDRVRLAFKLFDAEGVALVNVANNGSEGIRELGDELERLGGVITTEAANSAVEFNDALTRLNANVDAFKINFGPAAFGVLNDAFNFYGLGAVDNIQNIREELAELGERRDDLLQGRNLFDAFFGPSQAERIAELSEIDARVESLRKKRLDLNVAEREASENNEELAKRQEEVAEATANIDDALDDATASLKANNKELEQARKFADETQKSFKELFEEITAPEVEADVGVLDVFNAISRAQDALREGDNERAVEILTQGGEALKTLKEQGDVAGITLQDLATSLQRIATEAAAAEVQEELIDTQESQKRLDELEQQKEALEMGGINIKTKLDTTALDEFQPDEVIVPVRFELVGGVPAITDGTDVTSREATKRGFRP